MGTVRVAALDVGSNTVHLLIVDLRDGVELDELYRHVTMPRIGRAVDETGAVGPEMLQRAGAIVRDLSDEARVRGATVLLVGATAAVRRARDRDLVLHTFSEAAGVPCRLIAEEVEGTLSFRGALSTSRVEGRALVTDVGGGSSECVVGHRGEPPEASISVPIGSGTATVRWLLSDPPTDAERAGCAAGVRELLSSVPASPVVVGVATGGTASTLPRLLEGMPQRLDRQLLGQCRTIVGSLPSGAIAERFELDPARARVLAGGVEIVDAVREHFGLQAVEATHHGLREGMVLQWHDHGDAWWH